MYLKKKYFRMMLAERGKGRGSGHGIDRWMGVGMLVRGEAGGANEVVEGCVIDWLDIGFLWGGGGGGGGEGMVEMAGQLSSLCPWRSRDSALLNHGSSLIVLILSRFAPDGFLHSTASPVFLSHMNILVHVHIRQKLREYASCALKEHV